MTQGTQSNVATSAEAEVPLTLFAVTLPWNRNNPDEGDYSAPVWARDEDHAVRALAEEMANHSDSGCETEASRAKFAQAKVDFAPSYAAIRVASSALSDCRDLLAGPNREMTAEAAADFAALSAILKKYGAL